VTADVSTAAKFKCYKMLAECMSRVLFHVLVKIVIHCTLDTSVLGNSYFRISVCIL